MRSSALLLLLAACFSPSLKERDCGRDDYCPGDERCDLGRGRCVSAESIMHLQQVSAGDLHTCGIDQAQGLWCWGDNGYRQLGAETFGRPQLEPVQVYGAWQQVAAGDGATCALDLEGKLSCWGQYSPALAPERVYPYGTADDRTLLDLHLRHEMVCVVDAEHQGACVNLENDQTVFQGLLVDGAGASHELRQLVSGGTKDRVQLCAVTVDGRLYCWGAEDAGELGNGDEGSTQVPTRIGADASWQEVAMSDFHACAIDGERNLSCWGSNTHRETGVDAPGPVLQPERVLSSTIATVAVGEGFTCAMSTAGKVTCWGTGSSHLVDPSSSNDRSLAQAEAVEGLTADIQRGSAALTAGTDHVCLIDDEGQGRCWGGSRLGQLGSGQPADPPTAHEVATPLPPLADGESWREVMAGERFACATTSNDHLYCWGRNQVGQVTGTPSDDVNKPIQVPGTWTAADAGREHTCGLEGTTVKCWPDFVLPEPAPPTDHLACGNDVVCMHGTQDDQTWCWFRGEAMLRNYGPMQYDLEGTPVARELVAMVVDGDPVLIHPGNITTRLGFIDATVGGHVDRGLNHACAVGTFGADGEALKCVPIPGEGLGGYEYGQLASSSPPEPGARPPAVTAPDGEHWLTVTAGRNFSCGVTAKAAYCWGENRLVQLGDPGAPPYGTPELTQVKGLPTPLGEAVSMDAGADHTCLVTQGRLFCWGDNTNSQLGRGRTALARPSFVRQP